MRSFNAFEQDIVRWYLDGRPLDDVDDAFIEWGIYELVGRITQDPNFRIRRVEMEVDQGWRLVQVRACRDRKGWREFLEKHRLSPYRALNLMALYRFAQAAPQLFERLKHLKRGDLYRLAQLGPEEAALRHSQSSVEGVSKEG